MKQKIVRIPYGRQHISGPDIRAVAKVMRSDFLTQGPVIAGFETTLAGFCGAKYAVAFSSGTAALHGACFAAEITTGDEVITTPMTFAASANCVLYSGGKPVFADIRPDLPVIDPKEIAKKITRKTKAIIPVDYSGIPADYDEINQLARKNHILVIADGAHSLGALYKSRKVGTLADMTVFSFHPVKLITTGEGGMVVTNNPKFYERLLLFRNHGITKNPNLFKSKISGSWYYEMQELGFNYRLTDIQAALGVSQLSMANKFLQRRNEIALRYKAILKQEININLIQVPEDRRSAWHLFPISLVTKKLIKSKIRVVNKLRDLGIIVQVHYIPVHLHPYFQKKFGCKKGDYPNSEKFYEAEVSLPIFPGLTKSQINQTASALYSVFRTIL